MEPVDTNIDFIALEKQILAFWDNHNCFSKLMRKSHGNDPFRFIDGPITANNPMGVHHAWGRTLKDIYIRYKAHRGYDCRYQNGFDCQGLWVEVEVEKELGFNGKPDILKFGLENFSNACKERINKYSQIITQQSVRLGQWMDWDNSYYTHTDNNILGIWHFLKACHDKGWIYETSLPMTWCTRCGTSLSEHEMSNSYQEMSHLSTFIKLPVTDSHFSILMWTTTPWTLAANVALAVNPTLKYCEIDVEGEEQRLVMCHDAIPNLNEALMGRRHTVIREFSGNELVGLKYEPILDVLSMQTAFEHKIVPWKNVDPKEGTGVVHIAPGCGKEDYELSQALGLKILTLVDEEGVYTEDCNWLAGKSVQNIATDIVEHLKQHDKLFFSYMHTHNYPVCWRCKQEVIFRLVDEWFIKCDPIRPQLLEESSKVIWQPEFIGKRMDDWLRNMKDWCISRKRYWGLPLPFYKCSNCSTVTVVGSLEQLRQMSVNKLDDLPELHRPWIDSIKILCPECGKQVERIPEVGDCWLDAGIVPFSTQGYFQNREEWAKWYPIDWVCEMREQVRLWFYSMLFMGVVIDGRTPYERVLTYERVVSEDGAPFSKSGFMIKFDEAAEKMGVDTMRYLYANQSTTSELRFGYSLGSKCRRRLLSLWNIYSFFVTYAYIDKPDVRTMYTFIDDLPLTAKWLLARIYGFVLKSAEEFEKFNTSGVIREFESVVDDVSNWYVRTNRRIFWRSDAQKDKLQAYWALYQAIKRIVIVMSPVIPFVTEAIWQNMVRSIEPDAQESVHLTDWPKLDANWRDEKLLKDTEKVRQIIYLGLRLRNQKQIKVRQPLSVIYVLSPHKIDESVKIMRDLILKELNVKDIKILEFEEELNEEYISLDFRKAGSILKQNVFLVKEYIDGLDASDRLELLNTVKTSEKIHLPIMDEFIPSNLFVVDSRPKQNLVIGREEDLTVALNVQITDELLHEGWIRDLLRHCQTLRKDTGLRVEDRISLAINTTSEVLRKVIETNANLIKDETLAVQLDEAIEDAAGEKEIQINSYKVFIALKKWKS